MSEAHMHDNHRQRMRARIAKNGILSLEDHEILEYLLYPFVPRKDTNPIAHNLIAKSGSFAALLGADAKALRLVPNVTDHAALFSSSLAYNTPRVHQRHIRLQRSCDPYDRPVRDLTAVLEVTQ